jgi:hypothetical protein
MWWHPVPLDPAEHVMDNDLEIVMLVTALVGGTILEMLHLFWVPYA